ncbi:MAG: hypothetical protein GPOALKHO_000515 [Sodalis sp.]|nr:MAG: hypothetical protein GPOALKHO_000515 [Sodalis sp.]
MWNLFRCTDFLAKILTVALAIGALLLLVFDLRMRSCQRKGQIHIQDLGKQSCGTCCTRFHNERPPGKVEIRSSFNANLAFSTCERLSESFSPVLRLITRACAWFNPR